MEFSSKELALLKKMLKEMKETKANNSVLKTLSSHTFSHVNKIKIQETSYYSQIYEYLQNRNKEIIRYLPLIQKVISRLIYRFPPLIEAEDMLVIGVLGLIEALERYELGSLPFPHYAEIRIRGAILDELRKLDFFSRGLRKKALHYRQQVSRLKNRLGHPPSIEELAQEMQISLSQLEELRLQIQPIIFMEFEKLDYYNEKEYVTSSLNMKKNDDPFILMQQKETKEKLTQAFEKLPERERIVLFLYYFQDLTLKEIGRSLHLSESRICQIHQKACQRMKVHLDSDLSDLLH